MLTASEARAILGESPFDLEVKAVEIKIRSAAKQGNHSAWHYKQLTPQMKEHLSNSGYSFAEHFDNNEYSVNISWA